MVILLMSADNMTHRVSGLDVPRHVACRFSARPTPGILKDADWQSVPQNVPPIWEAAHHFNVASDSTECAGGAGVRMGQVREVAQGVRREACVCEPYAQGRLHPRPRWPREEICNAGRQRRGCRLQGVLNNCAIKRAHARFTDHRSCRRSGSVFLDIVARRVCPC